VLGFAITFGGIWILASQVGLPSTTTDSVSYGTALILALSLTGLRERVSGYLPSRDDVANKLTFGQSGEGDGDGGDGAGSGSDSGGDKDGLLDRLKALPWAFFGGVAALVGVPVLGFYALMVTFGLIQAIVITLTFGLGMLLLPFLTLIGQASSAVGGALGSLYLKLGMLGYRQPVLEWTPRKYRIREYDELETTDNVEWYNLFGTLLGITYEPGPESWDADPISHEHLTAMQEPVADGGESFATRLPEGKVRSDMKRDVYGGYLPKRLKDGFYYLHSGIVTNRFANSAIGDKALRKLLKAKDEHGADSDGIDDSTVLKTTVVTTVFGALAGIGLFILPAFL
jgi:hypothetical protein